MEGNALTLLGDVLTGTVNDAIAVQQQGGADMLGIPSGITNLDNLLGGFRKSEYYLIAGRSSSGKSALAFNFAMHAAQHGFTVGYVSLEMSGPVLALRYLSARTSLSTHYIERGKFSNGESHLLRQIEQSTASLPLYVYDQSMTVEQVTDLLDWHAQQGTPVDILFVDYLSLFTSQIDEEYNKVTDISVKLRQYSRDFDIPVVALAQLNRNVEHRENRLPVLSDLRSSGQLEQDATAVIMVYRQHYYDMMDGKAQAVEIENNARLVIAKNRHGPVTAINVSFQPRQMLWTDRQAGDETGVFEAKKGKKAA